MYSHCEAVGIYSELALIAHIDVAVHTVVLVANYPGGTQGDSSCCELYLLEHKASILAANPLKYHMDIIAIHGAWSSSISFNHLRSQIQGSWVVVDYDHASEGMWDIIQRSNDMITRPSIVIGHSLGGIAALHLHDNPLVSGIITLASPLAGLELNLLQIYLSRSKLITQIANDTHLIRDMKKRDYAKPVLHLVANYGFNPFIYGDSDGVLPKKVQTGWSCGKLVPIHTNHYEILQHQETIDNIKSFYSKITFK